MKRVVLNPLFFLVLTSSAVAQNVFNPADPIVRYDKTKALGTSQNPNPNTLGLQKWVSTPTNGVSLGTDAWDNTSFKAYFLNVNGVKMAFRIKFPKSYSNPDSINKIYPIMLFLHGAGEVGCPSNNGVYNNEKQLWLGGALFRDRVNNNEFDGFLVYPQLVNPDGCWGAWSETVTANLSINLSMIDSLAKYVRADIDRVLLTGLSGGGFGAWRMTETFPQRIAKAMPSAAAGSVSNRTAFVHIPMWFATGGKDTNPSPAAAEYSYNKMLEIGAKIRYTQYPDLGHAVWNRHWREPDFAAEMNDMHKANPLVFFQRNEFCPNETIAARLGITHNFYAYEWQRDGVTIATRTNGVNTIVLPEHVTSFTGNEIVVKSFGTYRVRFRRNAGAPWSVFSPKPAVVKTKATTQTAAITIAGKKSNVLPALDGSTTVPLTLPAGFINYEWFRVSDNVLVGNSQTFNAPVGVYKARYAEQFGCGTEFSPEFPVINANGTPKPDLPTNLITSPVSRTSIKLDWTQGTGETGFEVYRALVSGGPYSFVALTGADVASFTDTGLNAATKYYYIIRSVSNTGASAKSTESSAKTLTDNSLPTAPANLQYRGSTQTTVLLKWGASTDADGIKRYDIYANGAKMFSTTATTFNVVNLDSLKSYTFTVKAVDNNNNESPASNQVTAYTHRQGINYKYYTSLLGWTSLPNFNSLNPSKTGITDSININNTSIKTATTRYGFLWQGFIYAPATATYTFETRSDDGSKLYIDVAYAQNATAVVSNDGVHGPTTKTGTINLTQGYHAIAVTYFQGSSGSAMEVYWSNNAGLARERIPKNFFAFENGPAATPPAAPTTLSATAIAYNKIRLNWTDNSNNETGFEVVRSATSGGTYASVGTAQAGATSFVDSGLTASKAYFYKVRAINTAGESAFTPVASATTPAMPLTPPAPSNLDAESGAGTTISLSWDDNATNETGFRVYRSTNNTDFAAIATLSPNANAYSDENTVAATLYYYYVVAFNGSGEGEKSNTEQAKAGNTAPAIAALANMFAKTGQASTEDFTVTDQVGDAVTVNITNKPAFVSVSNISGSDYRITANPTLDNVGWYNLTVVATDNYGKSSTANFAITVADSKTRSVFINLGTFNKPAPAPWNNWLGNRAAGSVFANLKDENNVTTSVSVTSVTAWTGTTLLGHITGNNSGVVPDAVLESGIADNGAAKEFRFSGLNPSMLYNISFVGSQNEGLIATADYTSGTQTVSLDARYNTNRSANLNGIAPDVNGQISVTITRTGVSAFTYLNAIMIEEYAPVNALLNPENLNAEPLDRNRIALTWNDRTSNEDPADGYQLQRATDSMFTQNVVNISLPANTTSYINTGLTLNTKYWYRVRTKAGSDFSEYSNKFTTVTPASIISVNFNTTIANAPTPWNNTETSPMGEFVINDLKDQSGNSSNIDLRLTKVFNGEFTAGVNTGANSGVVPDNVLASNYWLDNSQVSQFKLTGLNQSRRYRIGFIGSSSSTGWFKGNYTATYTINGKTVYLNSWMNSTKIVYISDIVPGTGGEILIDFSTTAAAQWAFNAGMIIQEYTDPQGGSVLYMSNSTLEDEEDLTSLETSTLKAVAYPNPFSDNINIQFNNNSGLNKISADVYDINGRLLQRNNYSNIPAGRNLLKLTAPSYVPNSGVYIITIRVNGKIEQSIRMLRNKR
jgi:hypothetical protein